MANFDPYLNEHALPFIFILPTWKLGLVATAARRGAAVVVAWAPNEIKPIRHPEFFLPGLGGPLKGPRKGIIYPQIQFDAVGCEKVSINIFLGFAIALLLLLGCLAAAVLQRCSKRWFLG